MAHVLAARVAETSTTTGTGSFALAGALDAHRRFSAVCSVADTTEYVIIAEDGTWEEGIGTYSSANTLTRTTVTSSSTGSAINFAAGSKTVLMTPIASRVDALPRAGTTGQLLAKASGTDHDLAWTSSLTGVTLTDPAITGTILEDVYTITDGASVDIDPGNGAIQLWTLGASRTPTATNFAAGESVTLMIDDGTAYAVTWTTIGVTWKTNGGSAPVLATSGYTPIVLWKVGSTIFGARVGDA